MGKRDMNKNSIAPGRKSFQALGEINKTGQHINQTGTNWRWYDDKRIL